MGAFRSSWRGLVAVVACIVPARRATANGLAVMLRAD